MSDLRPLYRDMAARGFFFGLSIVQHRELIAGLIKKYRATSILDFGCGRGDAYFAPQSIHVAWGVSRPALYDPAFEDHDVAPLPGQRFDMVLCSDVLEHIPEDDLDEFVARLFSYANRAVWASVCCRPAKKFFPDGRNLHVTVRPIEWWCELFERHCGGLAWELTETA